MYMAFRCSSCSPLNGSYDRTENFILTLTIFPFWLYSSLSLIIFAWPQRGGPRRGCRAVALQFPLIIDSISAWTDNKHLLPGAEGDANHRHAVQMR